MNTKEKLEGFEDILLKKRERKPGNLTLLNLIKGSEVAIVATNTNKILHSFNVEDDKGEVNLNIPVAEEESTSIVIRARKQGINPYLFHGEVTNQETVIGISQMRDEGYQYVANKEYRVKVKKDTVPTKIKPFKVNEKIG